ncbi:MAG: kinase [Candidatus Andeanibacterium colombiense]|uniref:Kinase n=1 Tax=Candidatus Andeanibacterium colombiense TaxID=3121345 RepID=A0AAJ5X5Z6_9SPHN|nr:MAG: kinase [Sphingomonadaceae bacterium]
MLSPQHLLDALPADLPANLSSAKAACAIAARIMDLRESATPPLVGINGAQGSGKSTLTRLVGAALELFYGLKPCLLSLDDFYFGKPARYQLGDKIHRLCETRGVPGTHDTILLLDTLDGLSRAGPEDRTPLPRFDKLDDDRISREDWPEFTGRPDVILLEGWCVGLRAEDLPPFTGPINALEAAEDPDGAWFAWSLDELTNEYAQVWDRIALLVSIEVPDLETVIVSRLKQEQGLSAATGRPGMDRAEVTRFVQHYERFTRALWAAMPRRADMLFRRDGAFGFAEAVQ